MLRWIIVSLAVIAAQTAVADSSAAPATPAPSAASAAKSGDGPIVLEKDDTGALKSIGLHFAGKSSGNDSDEDAKPDLDPAVFPAGRVVQTMIHHIDVVIHRRSEAHFDLWVLRSFAESLAEWLLDQGVELGIGFAGA